MDWILSQEGVYQCRFVPDVEGQYQAHVAVKGWERRRSSAVSWLPGRTGVCQRGLKQDALKEMAAMTQGKYYDLSGGAPQGRKWPRHPAGHWCRHAAASEPEDKPIWNMPVLFVVMVSIAGGGMADPAAERVRIGYNEQPDNVTFGELAMHPLDGHPPMKDLAEVLRTRLTCRDGGNRTRPAEDPVAFPPSFPRTRHTVDQRHSPRIRRRDADFREEGPR